MMSHLYFIHSLFVLLLRQCLQMRCAADEIGTDTDTDIGFLFIFKKQKLVLQNSACVRHDVHLCFDEEDEGRIAVG
jgi:hypothetical protein